MSTLRDTAVRAPSSGGARLSHFNVSQAAEDLLRFAEDGRPHFGFGYSLDEDCGMIGPGELGLLRARSSVGKSTVVLNIISNTPKVPTVVFNMEMTPRRQAQWLACMTYDFTIPARYVDDALHSGSPSERDELIAGLRAMENYYPSLTFVMPDGPTVEDLAMTVDDIEDETGVRPQRVFIDHLKLMKYGKDYDGVNATTSKLHKWALADELAVICLQQVQRSGGGDFGRNDGHIPLGLSDGTFGGEDDADWIWGIYRPDKDPLFKKPPYYFKDERKYEEMLRRHSQVKGQTKLQVIKNRPYGSVNEEGITLYYDAHTMRLKEYGDN